jgi:hypothetical protein
VKGSFPRAAAIPGVSFRGLYKDTINLDFSATDVIIFTAPLPLHFKLTGMQLPQHIIDLVGTLFDQGLDDDTICFAVLQAYNSAKESYICIPETKEHVI